MLLIIIKRISTPAARAYSNKDRNEQYNNPGFVSSEVSMQGKADTSFEKDLNPAQVVHDTDRRPAGIPAICPPLFHSSHPPSPTPPPLSTLTSPHLSSSSYARPLCLVSIPHWGGTSIRALQKVSRP